jgi:hypothetical protein
MVKDKRHKTVKILIETGNVVEFKDIFEHIPKTTVADDLGVHFNRMARMIGNVNEIKVNDIFLLSGYFEIDAKVMFELVYNQRNNKKPSAKPKK